MFNFKKLFGKKDDGFFLQLEDEDATSKPAVKTEAKASAPPAVTATVVAADPVAPAVAAAITADPLDKKAAKAEEKAAKAAKRAAAKGETATADPAVTAPVTAPASVPAAPTITNFATDYLIKPSSISGRRMPGANMKGFLDLARQVEKPKPFKPPALERKGEK